MTDPAVEAANRAWELISVPGTSLGEVTEQAAREALAPLRELHKSHSLNCINHCCAPDDCEFKSVLCRECDQYWPCATARLIYRKDEL